MNALDALSDFIARHHGRTEDLDMPAFIRCFDADAVEIDYDTASADWPVRQVGDITSSTPTAGVGHYARLQLLGLSAGQPGESHRYRLIAPDWTLTGHVTEPWGAAVDVIIEDATSITPGMERFAKGAAAQA